MSNALGCFSDSLAGAVEAAGPSIVRVEARRRLPATGVVWSSDGLIVTTHHVVEQDENIGVGLSDGRTVTATLVGRDGWGVDTTRLRDARGSFVYREHDTTRVAAFVSLVAPAWTIVSSGAVEEFEDPELEEVQRAVARRHRFVLEGHTFELHGSCRRCRG